MNLLLGARRLIDGCVALPKYFWLLCGLALVVPALAAGWVADDYFHLLALREADPWGGPSRTPLDLFRFADGSPHRAQLWMERGIFPWWADPGVRLSFFRPLASLTHALDGWLWPSSSVLMHAHSGLWYAAVLAGAWLAFSHWSSSPRTATLSLALFAVDDVHAPVVGWIANRNALIAVACMLAALLAHHQFRRSGSVAAALVAHAAFALGLSAGEAAVACLPYWLGYVCLLDPRPSSRLRSLAGFALLLVIWRACYVSWDYGVSGSGLYIDPLADPVAFLVTAGPRLLALAMGLFAGVWSEAWELLPLLSAQGRPLLIALGALFLALLARPVLDVLRSRPRARFWLLGALGALLPVAASFPHDRLLLAASIGGAGFLAELIDAALSGGNEIRSRWVGPVLIAIHLIIAPAACLVRASSIDRLDALVARQQASLPGSTAVRSKTLVLLNPPLDPFAAYIAPYREFHGIPRPRALYWLATGVSSLTVTTLDAHTLLISPERGFLDGSTQRMLRAPARGTRYAPVQLAQASFEVTHLTADGRPSELRVTFLRPLSDPHLSFFRWGGTGYVPFVAPAPGASVILPAVDFASLL